MKLAKFLKTCDTDQLPAGLKAKLYLACTCDVAADTLRTYKELRALATLPSGVTLPSTENKLAERVTIGEPIAFSGTGNGFTAYDIVINSGSYNSKSQGETQFLSLNNDLMFSFAGTDAEVLGFTDMILNRGIVALIGDIGGVDDYNLFGMKDMPAFVAEVDINSGAKAGDKRIANFKISDLSGKVLKKYPLGTLHPSGLPMAA